MVSKKYRASAKEEEAIYDMISDNIKYYRINHNNPDIGDKYGRVSQEKLAEYCDISRSLVSNIESKKVKKTFSISVVINISKVLNVPFENFFKERKK